MKNTMVKTVLSAAMIVSMGAAQAEDELPGQQVIMIVPELNSHEYPVPVEATDTLLMDNAQINFGAPPLVTAASPLTNIQVYAIRSANCGLEHTARLMATRCDHGGEWLRVAILEIGYGVNPIVWMNGKVLPDSAQYSRTPVCITGGYYKWPCASGQTVVGYLNEYNLDGDQGGIFRYQNTSINTPWNTIPMQINIR